MGQEAQGLPEEQAVIGRLEVHPTPAELAGDAQVVLLRIVAKEAELESPLAGGRPMTGAPVAAEPGEDRQHAGAELETLGTGEGPGEDEEQVDEVEGGTAHAHLHRSWRRFWS